MMVAVGPYISLFVLCMLMQCKGLSQINCKESKP